MHLSGRGREREELERELMSKTGMDLLRRINLGMEPLRAIGTWSEFAKFAVAGPGDLLCLVLRARGPVATDCWSSAMLLACWAPLERLASRMRRWDEDQDELWQEVVAGFLGAARDLEAIPLERSDDSLEERLMARTRDRVRDRYRRAWRRRRTQVSACLANSADPRVDEQREADEDAEHSKATLRAVFHAAAQGGAIGLSERDLLVATLCAGEGLHELAVRTGRTYSALKKKRQRAMARLDAWRKKSGSSSISCPLGQLSDPPWEVEAR